MPGVPKRWSEDWSAPEVLTGAIGLTETQILERAASVQDILDLLERSVRPRSMCGFLDVEYASYFSENPLGCSTLTHAHICFSSFEAQPAPPAPLPTAPLETAAPTAGASAEADAAASEPVRAIHACFVEFSYLERLCT